MITNKEMFDLLQSIDNIYNQYYQYNFHRIYISEMIKSFLKSKKIYSLKNTKYIYDIYEQNRKYIFYENDINYKSIINKLTKVKKLNYLLNA